MSTRSWIAIYTVVWLAVVVAGLVLYAAAPSFPLVKPFSHGQAQGFAVAVWSALLGSVAINIKGIVDHRLNDQWKPAQGWILWYVLRPANGMVVGLATYVFLLAIDSGKSPSLPVLAAAALILGFQERRFFNFLSEVAKLVLTVPNDPAGGLSLTGVSPSQGHGGETVIIAGQGIAAQATVTFGAAQLGACTVSVDGTAAAGVVPALALPADQPSRAVDVLVANPDGSARVLRNGFTYIR